LEGLDEDLQFRLPADHREPATPRRPACCGTLEQPECRDGVDLALDAQRLDRLGRHGMVRQSPRRFREQDLASGRGLLEARTDVHGIAKRQALTGRRPGHQDLSGVHARPDGQLDTPPCPELLIQQRELLRHLLGCPKRPNSVILMQHRHAEDRHDRVADELGDRSPVSLDDRAHAVEIGLHDPGEGFRVQLVSQLTTTRLAEPCGV
jgi:hypothetical protein